MQEATLTRENIYRKLFKFESYKAAHDKKKDAFESKRLELEQHRIEMEREEKLLDRQARAAERAIDREVQEKQSEGLNNFLKHMADTKKAMQEGFLNVLERILDKK
jgi:excinuclease UvrABC helicase subunit UvrB